MKHPEYLEDMPNFKRRIGEVIHPEDNDFYKIIEDWAKLIKKQNRKGLIPLFITGSGVSKSNGVDVPDISGIIDILKKKYKDAKITDSDVDKLFVIQENHEKIKKKDRSTIARLLNTFQENDELKEKVWKYFNKELLERILKANPTTFHKKLADLYDNADAVCLTLNFDGLLIREFVKSRNKRAFSLPIKDECERFFLRKNIDEEKDYLEIQIRGDILYIICDTKGFCPQKDKEHSIWASASYPYDSEKEIFNKNLDLDKLLKCKSCGRQCFSSLSFPGSYDKEKDMQCILEVVWKYLAFRVGTVTVVGMSGEWDPLIIAFLGDLLSEREIPLLIVDKNESTYIIKELVKPKIHNIALEIDADSFMNKLLDKFDNHSLQNIDNIMFQKEVIRDEYWDKEAEEYQKINNAENNNDIIALKDFKLSNLEYDFKEILKNENLNKFAQLGLKSYWLGIKPSNNKGKYHKRYNHSVGVMKIASYLYNKAIKNSGYKENPSEKQFLRLAALLHDVGHLPFSHLIEDVFKELNWKPAEYKDYYSHTFQTDGKIEEIFSANAVLKQQLNNIGYNVTDLKNLINGRFGVGFLDAIINSPLDADKIDYVFRDTSSTDRKISLSPMEFLKDIASDLIITPEKYLSFSGISAKVAAEILQTRRHLYQNLYLQPEIIILEGIVKLIIKTYFVHSLKLDKKLLRNGKEYPDLGDYKISYCIDGLQNLFKGALSQQNNIELEIVSLMYNKIVKEEKYLGNSFFTNIKEGFSTIKDTDNEDKLKALGKNIIYKRFNWQNKSEKEIKDTARDVMFRIPGAAIIEVSRLPDFLSTADSRKERERSDGTKTFSECIIIPDGDYEMWTPLSKSSKPIHESSLINIPKGNINVFLYPLSGNDDSYFKQACNLFDNLLNKKGIYSQGQ